MKTRTSVRWIKGLLLTVLSLGVGLIPASHGAVADTSPAKPIPQATNPVVPPVAPAPAPMLSPLIRPEIPGQVVPVKPREPLSTNLFVSAWFGEVVRLVQAGIDENVILSYVMASGGTFNLGADQIIYLRDLGVSSDLINAMLLRDQEISSGMVPTSTAPLPAVAMPLKFRPIPDAAADKPATAPISAPDRAGEVRQLPAPVLKTTPVPKAPAPAPAAWPTPPAAPAFQPSAASDTEFAMNNEPETTGRPALRTSAPAKETISPVREPNAVELTAPIYIMWARPLPAQMANTLRIELVPRR